MARPVRAVAGGGGAVVLVALWLPWFQRRVAAGVPLVAVPDDETGWAALGGRAGLVVAATAVVAVVWAVRPGGPLSGAWIVTAGALALVVTVGVTASRMGDDSAAVVTFFPAWGLLVAYAGGTAVLLAGVATLVAYARERSKSA